MRRSRGKPGSRGRVLGGGWIPGGRMELATRSQVRVRPLVAAPTPPRPSSLCSRPSSPPWAGNVALGRRVVARTRPVPRTLEPRALQVCAVGHCCASWTGEPERLRTGLRSGWVPRGRRPGRCRPEPQELTHFEGSAGGEAAGAQRWHLLRSWNRAEGGDFFRCAPPTFSGNWHRDKEV